MLVGQHNRRQPNSALGEQNHVLHHHCLWVGYIMQLLGMLWLCKYGFGVSCRLRPPLYGALVGVSEPLIWQRLQLPS